MENYISVASKILDKHIDSYIQKSKNPQEYKLKKIISYINKIKNTKEENSYDYTSNYINKSVYEIIKILGEGKSQIYQLETTERLASIQLFKDEYNKYIESELSKNNCENSVTYNSNLHRSYQLMIQEADEIVKEKSEEERAQISKMLPILKEYESSKGNKKDSILKKNPWLQNTEFKEQIRNFSGTNFNNIYNIIQTYNSMMKETLKEKQIEILVFLGRFLDKFNLLEDYVKRHDKYFKKIKGIDLSYDLETGKYNKDEIGVKELFTKEFLKTQDLETLLALSIFWQNRFSKEIKNINDAMFFIKELDLENKEDIYTSIKDNYAYVENKTECINRLTKYIESATRKGIGDKDEVEGGTIIYIEDELLEIKAMIGDRYNSYFSEIKPNSKHDVFEDICSYLSCVNNAKNIYLSKDSILRYFIRKEENKKGMENWGIIPSKNNHENRSRKSKNILIGIDIQGLNMPLRFHINDTEVIEALTSAGKEPIIPKYQGSREFEQINGEVIPTNILMPLQKEQVKNIRETLKKIQINQNYNNFNIPFLEHMLFLNNHKKMPKHFERIPTYLNLKDEETTTQQIKR